MAVNIKIHGFNITDLSSHTRPLTSMDRKNKKCMFDRNLRKACAKKEKHEKLIVAGEFNA